MTVETRTETRTVRRVECPSCGKKAKRVSPVTLGALLKEEFAEPFAPDSHTFCDSNGAGCQPVTGDTGWRFCDSPDCDVVYFSEEGDTRFTKSQLKVPVGVKETGGERPLCYCFGHSVGSIKDELRTKGRSDAIEDIRAKMTNPGCHCETSNPSGSCCLGSVTKGIQIAQEESEMNELNLAPATRAKSSTSRGERIAKIGTVISAIMASACCWFPLVLLAVGVSGAGIAATLETYRPLFIVVTFGFLAAAFYFTYRPRKSVAARDDCCAVEQAAAADCCEPIRARRFSVMAMNKVMLWGVTALSVAFLLFPSYVGALFGIANDTRLTENMNRVVFHIEGMTCEGCATTVAQAIRQVPGVAAVEVSYEKSEAIVGVEPGNDVPVRQVLAAIRNAGYRGTATTGVSTESDQTDPAAVGAPQNDELTETVFRVDGMSCEGCATALAESLRSVPGVTGVRVEFESGRAHLQNPACCTLPVDVVIETIEKSGFRGHVESSNSPQNPKGDQK